MRGNLVYLLLSNLARMTRLTFPIDLSVAFGYKDRSKPRRRFKGGVEALLEEPLLFECFPRFSAGYSRNGSQSQRVDMFAAPAIIETMSVHKRPVEEVY
jgi:hypothetical protein